MNPEQIKLVQSSLAKVRPIAEPAAAIFYSRLFELAPQVRPLFKGDMGEQGHKLMAMPHVREAWSTACGVPSSAMIEAHHSAERP